VAGSACCIRILARGNLIVEMKLCWAIFVAFAYAFGAYAQEVSVHREPSANFKSFATYAWKQEEVARYPAVHAAIMEAVDEQLARKGVRKVQVTSQPDLIVRYTGERTVETVQRSTSTNNLWRENGGTATVAPQKRAIGELQLIVSHPGTSEAVWTANGKHSLTEIDDEKNRKIIRNLVKKMFQQFPSVKTK